MKKFEYKIVKTVCTSYPGVDGTRSALTVKELNKMGEEGWELVSLSVCQFNTYNTYHFKREL